MLACPVLTVHWLLGVPEHLPVLAGTKIVVTAQRGCAELAGALEQRGAAVTAAPTLGTVRCTEDADLLGPTREIVRCGADDVVVTTGAGFHGWLDAADSAGFGAELREVLAGARLIARGPKARAAISSAGLSPDWVAESETVSEIVELMVADGVAGRRVVVQHHGQVDAALEDALRAAGAAVTPLQVYRWGPPAEPGLVSRTVADTVSGGFDAVLFTSAPAAQAWISEVEAVRGLDLVRDLAAERSLLLAAVGPLTAAPLLRAGLVARYPDPSRLGALVRLVIRTLGDEVSGVRTPAGVLQVRAAAATLDHEVLALSPNGLAILRQLARHPGQVVSRERLLAALPGHSSDPHTAEVAVARLRDSLGPHRLVRTVIKRGYVLATS